MLSLNPYNYIRHRPGIAQPTFTAVRFRIPVESADQLDEFVKSKTTSNRFSLVPTYKLVRRKTVMVDDREMLELIVESNLKKREMRHGAESRLMEEAVRKFGASGLQAEHKAEGFS